MITMDEVTKLNALFVGKVATVGGWDVLKESIHSYRIRTAYGGWGKLYDSPYETVVAVRNKGIRGRM